jgi:hypothetical protein
MIPLCLMWCVWRERNVRCSKDCETGLMNLKKVVMQTLLLWRETLQSMSECSYYEFLDRCSFFFKLGVRCILPVYRGLRPSALF